MIFFFKFRNILVGSQVKTTLKIIHKNVWLNVFLHLMVDKLFTIREKIIPTGLRFQNYNNISLGKLQLCSVNPSHAIQNNSYRIPNTNLAFLRKTKIFTGKWLVQSCTWTSVTVPNLQSPYQCFLEIYMSHAVDN